MCRPAAACGPSSCSRNIPGRSARPRCNDGSDAVTRRAQRRMMTLRPPFAVAIVLAAIAAARAEPDAGNIEAGATIYGDYCSSCHGDALRNTSGGVTFDLRRLRAEDHDRFVDSVLNGRRQMPPWRGALKPEQIESIWAYIRATVDR